MSIEASFHLRRGAFVLEVKLHIPARGVTVVFGPSGSGKTLLLRCISGLEFTAQGYCRFGAHIWQDEQRFVPTHRRPLGYVFQEASLFPHLSVEQNLRYGMQRIPPGERRIGLEEVVELLGVQPLLARRTQNLSGGERQRVAMARALLTSPRMLLMDEPLAALDDRSKQEILPYLDRLHQQLEIPVIYVTHDSEEMARLADHLVLLEGGRVRAAGEAQDILTRIDLPLAQARTAQAVIPAEVVEHDEADQLTYLQFEGGRFAVAYTPLAVGRSTRLRIVARDVSVTLTRPTQTSILNIFAASVADLSEPDGGQVTVRLALGRHYLLARITLKSARALQLTPGKPVFVQIKSVAVVL